MPKAAFWVTDGVSGHGFGGRQRAWSGGLGVVAVSQEELLDAVPSAVQCQHENSLSL